MRSILYTILTSMLLAFTMQGQRSVREYMFGLGNSPDTNVHYFFQIPENEDFDFFVGVLNGPVNYPSDVLDNNRFYVRNDSLFTRYSFDFEGALGTEFNVAFTDATGLDTAIIEILDVFGKWDSNGVADNDIANYYPGVNAGDYIIWNYTSGQEINIAFDPSVAGRKILLHGKSYDTIRLDMSGVTGTSPSNQSLVTNFLGQVEVNGTLELVKPFYCRLSGKFDAANGIGHRYFTGCDQNGTETDFSFSHGKWGIYLNNRWQSEISGSGLLIETNSTAVEIDHLEIANGYKTGMEIGWTNTYGIGDYHYIHHNFVHDIGGEGIMFGLPGGFPQQVFTNATIENNVVLRTGSEGIQASWISLGSRIRNNVIHAAVDWKDPYARWQDGVLQVFTTGNAVDITSNILMGGGTVVSDIKQLANAAGLTYAMDTVRYSNNLVYCNRSNSAIYQHPQSDNLVQAVFEKNYFSRLGYDLDEVYQNGDTTSNTAINVNNSTTSNILRDNLYDFWLENISGGTANTIETNNNVQALPYPQFENYLNRPAGFNYMRIHRYAAQIGTSVKFPGAGTNKGNNASWEAGDIVQTWNSNGETRFYECVQNESSGSIAPPADDSDNSHWQLLTWTRPNGTTSYFPPDNVRLSAGSFYDLQNVGIRDVIPGTGQGTPGNKLPSILLTGINNGELINKAVMRTITANTSDPDGQVVAVKFFINGVLIATDSTAPFTLPYLADSTGNFNLTGRAFDNLGDSVTSAITQFSVTADQFFRVLHYAETGAQDHGTAVASYNMLQSLGQTIGFEVDNDLDGSSFNSLANLQTYQVIVFSNTSGDSILNLTQRQNFEAYMNAGGAFFGIHGAAECFRHSTAGGPGNWDWYAEMLGASPQSSPVKTAATYNGTMDVIGSHPSTQGLSNPWSKQDAYYYWENGYENPQNNVVLQVRNTGFQSYDARRAVSWYRYLPTGGRSFYTALGHDSVSFASNSMFITHVKNVLLWSISNLPPLVSIASPVANDTLIVGQTFNVVINASDADGSVDSVRVSFGNQQKLLTAAPWQTSFTLGSVGTKSISATAYDDKGDFSTAQVQNIYGIDTTATCFDGIQNQNETGIDCGGVCAPCAGTNGSLKKLLTYFHTAYHADSTYVNQNGTQLTKDGDEVGYLKDIAGKGYHAPWTGGFITVRYPYKPKVYKRPEGTYIHINNALDREWTTRIPKTTPPIHTFYVIRPTENFRYFEAYNIFGAMIRNKGNALYALKWSNETKFSGGGILRHNKMTIVEVTIDAGGNGKMWVNGVPYNNGQTVQVGNAARDIWGYGTNSHIGGHQLFMSATRFGIMSSAQRDSVYKHINALYDVGAYPTHPVVENFKTTFNTATNVFSVTSNTVLYNNIPIDSIYYQWYMEGPSIGAGNRLDRIIPIQGATSATLDRDDYPQSQYFGGTGKATGKSLYRSVMVVDKNGNRSWWIEGDHFYDNID